MLCVRRDPCKVLAFSHVQVLTRQLGCSSRLLSKGRGEETKPSERSRQTGRYIAAASFAHLCKGASPPVRRSLW
jgi:hypothetical protein